MTNMFSSRVVCSVGSYDELVAARLLSRPSRFCEYVGRLDAGRPDHELGRNEAAVRQPHSSRADLSNLRRNVARARRDSPAASAASERRCGKRREDAIGSFDEIDLDVLLRIDPIEAIRDELARRVVQLRRKLRAGCACPDDRDLELLGPQRLRLRVPTNVGIHKPAVEALGLVSAYPERLHALARPACRNRCSGCHRDNEGVVTKSPPRRHLMAFIVDVGGELNFAPPSIEADHLANAVVGSGANALAPGNRSRARQNPCFRPRFHAAAASTDECAICRSA